MVTVNWFRFVSY